MTSTPDKLSRIADIDQETSNNGKQKDAADTLVVPGQQENNLSNAFSMSLNVLSPSVSNADGINALDSYLSQKLESILRTHPLLKAAQNNSLFITEVGKLMHLRYYRPGDVVIKEGDPAKAMFFIIKGSVQIISEDGEFVVCEMSEGWFFGEIGVLFDVNRTATAIAKTKCILATLQREDFQATLEKYVDVGALIRQEAQQRYQVLKRKLETVGKEIKSKIESIQMGNFIKVG